MIVTILPGSFFDDEEGVSCRDGLPVWALVEYVTSVESREPIGTPQPLTYFDMYILCELISLIWTCVGVIYMAML